MPGDRRADDAGAFVFFSLFSLTFDDLLTYPSLSQLLCSFATDGTVFVDDEAWSEDIEANVESVRRALKGQDGVLKVMSDRGYEMFDLLGKGRHSWVFGFRWRFRSAHPGAHPQLAAKLCWGVDTGGCGAVTYTSIAQEKVQKIAGKDYLFGNRVAWLHDYIEGPHALTFSPVVTAGGAVPPRAFFLLLMPVFPGVRLDSWVAARDRTRDPGLSPRSGETEGSWRERQKMKTYAVRADLCRDVFGQVRDCLESCWDAGFVYRGLHPSRILIDEVPSTEPEGEDEDQGEKMDLEVRLIDLSLLWEVGALGERSEGGGLAVPADTDTLPEEADESALSGFVVDKGWDIWMLGCAVLCIPAGPIDPDSTNSDVACAGRRWSDFLQGGGMGRPSVGLVGRRQSLTSVSMRS